MTQSPAAIATVSRPIEIELPSFYPFEYAVIHVHLVVVLYPLISMLKERRTWTKSGAWTKSILLSLFSFFFETVGEALGSPHHYHGICMQMRS